MTSKPTSAARQQWPAVDRRKSGWAIDWQSTVERDKATLARSLHDNTGGLLVAAVMDVTWAESHLQDCAPDVQHRLARARSALNVAIDLNRRMIEDLRPSLLDDLGLIPALKWHSLEACKAAEIACDLHLPESATNFSPAAAIAIYRIAQTLIALMASHQVRALNMVLTIDGQGVTLVIGGRGTPVPLSREEASIADALASVTGRVRALGGEMLFDTQMDTAVVTSRIPADKALTL